MIILLLGVPLALALLAVPVVTVHASRGGVHATGRPGLRLILCVILCSMQIESESALVGDGVLLLPGGALVTVVQVEVLLPLPLRY